VGHRLSSGAQRDRGRDVPLWFGAAKFAATLATAVSGLPGGIFAPSLSIGAGIGDMLRSLLPAIRRARWCCWAWSPISAAWCAPR
jgi:H+/Cl- antiporter ClcA